MDDEIDEILRAYKIDFPSSNTNVAKEIVGDISQSSRVFPYIVKGVTSSRRPEEITIIARMIGMYIPIWFRYGKCAYEYFIDNAYMYEACLCPIVDNMSIAQILASDDPGVYLSNFTDEEILGTFGYSVRTTWKTRKELLTLVVEGLSKGRKLDARIFYPDVLFNERVFCLNDEFVKMSDIADEGVSKQAHIIASKAFIRKRNEEDKAVAAKLFA